MHRVHKSTWAAISFPWKHLLKLLTLIGEMKPIVSSFSRFSASEMFHLPKGGMIHLLEYSVGKKGKLGYTYT